MIDVQALRDSFHLHTLSILPERYSSLAGELAQIFKKA